ncbi:MULTISPECIES: hypothetical protein [unclassified Adlercreutzia]|uniref:hypothetical protein n=1 Tax=unclassified Adlercreutzia TaxID=2636013 RepID=UPI0013EC6355|nr:MULTISPECIES: hypothetical protein [unclassified Adlercreutzia]
MQTNHSKAIKGLSIAVIVFSAISIIGCVVGLFALGVGGAVVNEHGSEIFSYSLGHVDHAMPAHGYDAYHGGYVDEYLDEGDLMGWTTFGLIAGAVTLVWGTLCAVVTLVAGIIGLRGADVREKLGRVFGWGIAGAVASLLSGRVITCVLMVIAAVYANKDKNAPGYGAPGAMPGYGAPAGYATPGYGAPAYGAPQPAQPYAYGQQPGYTAPQPVAQPAPQGAAASYAAQLAPQPTSYQQTYGAPQPAAQPLAQPVEQPAAQVQPVEQPAIIPQPAVEPASAPAGQPAAAPEPASATAPEPEPQNPGEGSDKS